MKRSELKQLIREVIEEEFMRSPANQLDNIFGRADPSQLKDKKFLFSSIVNVLKNAQFLDSRTVSDIRKMMDWRSLNTSILDQAVKYIQHG